MLRCACITRVIFILFLFLPLTSFAADATSTFNQGITAFESKDYSHAIELFETARKLGFKKPSLDYNLGVSYYKIGRYQDAESAFQRLTSDPTMQDLAFYNLGLLAAKQNQDADAKVWFMRAHDSTQNPKLKALSSIALSRFETTKKTAPAKNQGWNGLLSATIAHDSNVTLEDVGSLVRDDNYYELLATGGVYIYGNNRDGLRVGLQADALDYSTENAFDYKQLGADLSYYKKLDQWYTRTALKLNDSWLGSTGYLRIGGLELRGDKILAKRKLLRLRYRYDNIASKDTLYDYLEGNRHQFRIESRMPLDSSRLKLSYEIEVNDRNDFTSTTTPEFRSYSPMRNSVRAELAFGNLGNWSPELKFRYRVSDYPDDYISALGTATSRSDKQLRTGINIKYQLEKNLNFELGYEYTNNSSSLSVYDYNRSVLSLNVNWYN